MNIAESGSRSSGRGPGDCFTPRGPDRCAVQRQFHAGRRRLRTACASGWHAHPFGRTLPVTDGLGGVPREDGRIDDSRLGDIVQIGPGEKHWHGTTPGWAITPIAIAAMKDGSAVTWIESVTDGQYTGEDR